MSQIEKGEHHQTFLFRCTSKYLITGTRFDGVFILKLDVKLLWSRFHLLVGEHCTHIKHRGCHNGQSLKRGCCCSSVYRGCAVGFEIPRKCGFIWYYTLRSIQLLFAPRVGSYFLRMTIGNMVQTQTQKHRPWPSQREELAVQLLLYRGCHKGEG